ncbi:hypothetical protein R1flu_006143 [Riccia fluitans]|uniref:Uncharacterized protein n=1 Tax=Riccia fluitans TaxID=41844 RepID=A0ABD1YW76_9MARC
MFTRGDHHPPSDSSAMLIWRRTSLECQNNPNNSEESSSYTFSGPQNRGSEKVSTRSCLARAGLERLQDPKKSQGKNG